MAEIMGENPITGGGGRKSGASTTGGTGRETSANTEMSWQRRIDGGSASEEMMRQWQEIYGPQAGLLQQMWGGGSDLFQQGGLAQVAGFNPFQQAGQQMTADYAMNGLGQGIGQTQAAYGQALSGGVDLSPYNQVADAITQRMTSAFQNEAMPGVRRGNLSAAGRPTSRAGIAADAASQGFQQNLGSALSQTYLPAYQQAQQNRMGALGMAPGMMNLGFMPGQAMMGIGGQQQQLQQQQMNAPWMNLQRYQGLLGAPITLSGSASDSASESTVGTGTAMGNWMSGAGSMMGGMGGGG